MIDRAMVTPEVTDTRRGEKNRFLETVTYVNYISIRRPIDTVFNYMTAPGNWPVYHPISKRVVADPNAERWLNYPRWPEKYPLPQPNKNVDVLKPLAPNDVILEDVTVGHLTQRVSWIGLASVSPHYFAILGKTDDLGGMESFIEYSFAANEQDKNITEVKRLVIVKQKSLFLKVIGVLGFNKFVVRFWEEAMNNMKRILETGN